jgi:hypothetical protein
MDIFGMLTWVVVLVTLIVFIVLLVKTFKSWGTAHAILLSLLFIESWTFIFFAASVSHQRLSYTKAHDTLMNKVEKLSKTLDEQMFGDRLDPALNLEKFVPLSNEVNRIALERGRVWRGAIKQAATPNGATLLMPATVTNLPVAPPAEAAGAAGAQAAAVLPTVDQGLAPESVVYLFGESPSPFRVIPTVYLGEYVVTGIKDNLVSVRPTTPLSQDQLRALGGSESCAVYEVLPIDSHTAFAAEGSKPEDDALFGRMDEKQIEELFAMAEAQVQTKVSDARRSRIREAYLQDGGQASEQTPPESLAYRVKFLKDHSILVDSTEKRSAMEGGFYDLSGRTVDTRLKLDAEEGVAFKTDDTYIFDSATAKDWEMQGIVALEARLFVRPLNDYEFAFRETRRLWTKARQDLLLITREFDEMVRTSKVVSEQEILRGEEGKRLALDKAQYGKELEVINEVHGSLTQQVEDKKTELSQLYGTVVSLHDRLVQRSKELASILGSGVVAP